jgi:hypothetical protein
MRRRAIDRWTDTTGFRFTLLFASLVVMPVLALGVLTTAFGVGAVILSDANVEIEHAAFGLLSFGGVLGLAGYLRAHAGVKHPERHGITTTLVYLSAGIVTALAVAGVALSGASDLWESPWDARPWVAAPLLFAAANVAWALSGVAWMQRLLHRYTEKTGRAFDGLPVVLLSLSLALAVAAALNTTTL